MAVQNCIGDGFRGATWVALHNGGGVGWGEVVNGGFGLVLDGSDDADFRAANMLNWDVSNGIARRYHSSICNKNELKAPIQCKLVHFGRCWSGNSNARLAIQRAMDADPRLKVTLPNYVDED